MKKKILIVAAAILLLAAGTGIGILASGGYGSTSDPLITLSYLRDKFTPEMEEKIAADVDSALSGVDAEIEARIDQFEADINAKLESSTVAAATDTFSVVTLSYGQKIICSVGAEIMLRIGSAEAYGEDYPALVDLTDSQSYWSGTDMDTNHMYMVTIKGCGIRATSETVKVLIRGTYTVE